MRVRPVGPADLDPARRRGALPPRRSGSRRRSPQARRVAGPRRGAAPAGAVGPRRAAGPAGAEHIRGRSGDPAGRVRRPTGRAPRRAPRAGRPHGRPRSPRAPGAGLQGDAPGLISPVPEVVSFGCAPTGAPETRCGRLPRRASVPHRTDAVRRWSAWDEEAGGTRRPESTSEEPGEQLPTIQQLVRKGRSPKVTKTKAPALKANPSSVVSAPASTPPPRRSRTRHCARSLVSSSRTAPRSRPTSPVRATTSRSTRWCSSVAVV